MTHFPMRPISLALLLMVSALAFAPPPGAQAHAGHSGFQQTKIVGPHYLSLEVPNVPFPAAMSRLDFNAAVGHSDPRAPGNVTAITIDLSSPSNQSRTIRLENGTYGLFSTSILFEEQGTWRANATIEPANLSALFEFEVYGPSPYVVTSPSADTADGDVFLIGRPARLELATTYLSTGLPAPEARDATARVEWWTDDHKTKLGEEVVPLAAGGPGVLVLEHTFEEAGMYHVFVASPTLELEYDDRPYIHVFAVTREQAQEMGIDVGRESPGARAALALCAAAAVGFALRRRGRPPA